MNNKRKSPSKELPKKARTFSFSGEEGYEMLDFLDKEGHDYPYGKSGLVIDLLKIYKKAKEVLGDDDTMFQLKMMLELKKQEK